MARKITLKDVAAQLGVSAATVSRALHDSHEISEPLRRKIQRHVAQIGYRPHRMAANLRRGSSMTFGVVVPSLAYDFNVRLIEGIEQVAIPAGYKVLIFQTMEDEQREREAVEYLLSTCVDGIIASIAVRTRNYDHFARVRAEGKPLVLVDRTCPHVDASEVAIDHEAASYQAVRHLVHNGCRTIAWLSGPRELPLCRLRQRGYEKALRECGLPFEDRLIGYCNFEPDMGFAAVRQLLLNNPDIDGIYAINDRIAIGAMAAVHSLGKRIPADIAVVGFNNEPYNPLLNPALSSVYQPAREMGAAAGRLLLGHLKERTFRPHRQVLDTGLIVRASSSRASNR